MPTNQGVNFLIKMMLIKEAPRYLSEATLDKLIYLYTNAPIEDLEAEQTRLLAENPNSTALDALGKAIRIRKNDSQREF
jgi:hypothetical protein